MANIIPIFLEILVCFILSTSLLSRYSNLVSNNIVTVVGVFISWFFSFMVVFLLPADLISTAYRQCLLDYEAIINSTTTTTSTTTVGPSFNSSVLSVSSSPIQDVIITGKLNETSLLSNQSAIVGPNSFSGGSSISSFNNGTIPNPCKIPWNYVSENSLTKLWRFIYWTSQFLTWFLLPVMQSYSMAGDFTTIEKLKSALKSNLIYYSTIGAIFTTLLVYVIIKSGFDLPNLKVIAITSSNTWGLFLLVVLLGYGLVELPRYFMDQSRCFQSLSRHYFRVGKLNAEKCVAEEQLDDVLEEVHRAYSTLKEEEHNPLHRYLSKIISRCPPDWKRRSSAFRSQATVDPERNRTPCYDLQTLTGLHRRIIKAAHYHRQMLCRWNRIITEVIEWEDVARNYMDIPNPITAPRAFKSTLPKERSLFHSLYNPRIEWYWKCVIRVWFFRLLGLVAATLSTAVVWSEITFPMAAFAPRMSIFAYFVDSFARSEQYFYLELFSIISIGYLAICAFYTVFHMKIYNVYYLAPNKQTDEYSLSFSGMLVCRLAAPLCLNYLCLVNRDSHFIKYDSHTLETSFTSIMGHLDLIPIVNSGLNIFLPLCISAICLAIYFDFGLRLLHYLGYEQFIENDEMTVDLVQTGRELVEREKAKLLRNYESGTGAYYEMISAKQSVAPSSAAPRSYTTPTETNTPSTRIDLSS